MSSAIRWMERFPKVRGKQTSIDMNTLDASGLILVKISTRQSSEIFKVSTH